MASRVTIERIGDKVYRVRAPALDSTGAPVYVKTGSPASAKRAAEKLARALETAGWQDVARMWITEGIHDVRERHAREEARRAKRRASAKKRAKRAAKKPESLSKRILRGTRMWLLKRAVEAKKKAARIAARKKKDMATKKRAAKKSAKKSAKKPGKRKLNAALSKKLKPSAALAAVIGAAPVGRGTAVKKLWVYIKRHKLQVPTDKRSVKPDAKLAKVFGGPRAITMFMITKKLSAHLS